MEVTIKYNKNTQKVTFESDGVNEYSALFVTETDDEISMRVIHDIDPEALEEPIQYKTEIPE